MAQRIVDGIGGKDGSGLGRVGVRLVRHFSVGFSVGIESFYLELHLVEIFRGELQASSATTSSM